MLLPREARCSAVGGSGAQPLVKMFLVTYTDLKLAKKLLCNIKCKHLNRHTIFSPYFNIDIEGGYFITSGLTCSAVHEPSWLDNNRCDATCFHENVIPE